MNDEEKLKQWLEDNGCPEYCSYCIWESDCPKGIVCYGGEPVEPPCCGSEPEDFLDMEAILKDIEEEQ